MSVMCIRYKHYIYHTKLNIIFLHPNIKHITYLYHLCTINTIILYNNYILILLFSTRHTIHNRYQYRLCASDTNMICGSYFQIQP